MTRRPPVLPVLLALVFLLSGCLGQGEDSTTLESGQGSGAPSDSRDDGSGAARAAPEEPVMLVEDAEGDAREWNRDYFRDVLVNGCSAVRDLQGTCSDVGGEAPIEGIPAREGLDITGLSGRIVDGHLEATIHLASLEPGFANAVDADQRLGAQFGLAFDRMDDGDCTNALGGFVYPLNGQLTTISVAQRLHNVCPGVATDGDQWGGQCSGRAGVCLVHADMEATFGTPGAVTFRAPTWWLGPGPYYNFSAGTNVVFDPEWGAWRIGYGGVVTRGTLYIPHSEGYSVDSTENGGRLEVPLASAPNQRPSMLPDIDIGTPEDPSLDIVHLGINETPTHLAVQVGYGRIAAGADIRTGVNFVAGNESYVLLYFRTGGVESTTVQRDSDLGAGVGPVENVPAEVEVEEGQPGTVTFHLRRADLRPIAAGSHVQGFMSLAGTGSSQYPPAILQETLGYSYIQNLRMTDLAAGPNYVFQFDAPDDAVAEGISGEDDEGDVVLPADLSTIGQDPRAFDITGFSLVGEGEHEARAVVQVQNLNSVEVPLGYDAVVYAVQTAVDGGDIMLGYILRTGQAGTAFCAQDTLFGPNPTDPSGVPWTATGRGQVTAGSGAGIVAIYAPRACLGDSQGLEQPLETLAAGTFLLRTTATGSAAVSVLDTAERDGGVLAFASASAVAPPSFWAEPFGITNFWDIIGVALAILTVLVSAGLVLRRRARLRAYLRDVDRLRREHSEDPVALQNSLAALHRDLRRALDKGRIPTDHYGIVETRLDRAYVRARLAAFGFDYADIPHGVVVALERLIKDGEFSRADMAVAKELLANQRHIAAARKREISSVLDAWAADDEARTAGA